jgi:uncharacterized protein (TIGR03435 family)
MRISSVHEFRTPAVVIYGLALALGGFGAAQDRGAKAARPVFDVASIHRSDPKTPGPTIRFGAGGSVSIRGITLQNLTFMAYGVKEDQLRGAPKWLESERYDIEAKPAAGSFWSPGERANQEAWSRIRALLEDRCQLKTHRESKIVPVYVLTVAKTGPKMTQAKGPDPDSSAKGRILPWKMVVTGIEGRLGRPVIDHTGLSGSWHVALRYTSDDGQPAAFGVPLATDSGAGQWGPSLLTALQEQLGLKAESSKGPVETLVIDSVSRPSDN